VAQVGRISGPLLKDNLERNGKNLAFSNTFSDTELLYLDVNTGRIGINNDAPSRNLDISGTSQTTNLIVPTLLSAADFEITDSTIRVLSGDINLNAADAIVMANMETGTIRISDNNISTIISNANIDLTPNGTGTTEIINDLNVTGNLHTEGNLTFDGSIVLGNSLENDTVSFNAVVDTDIIPSQTNTYSLGSTDQRWDLYTNLVNGKSISVDELQAGLINFNLRHAGKLYVSIEGNDTNVGDHIQGPLATISEALSRAESSNGQPVLIFVTPGEYQETLPLVVPPNVSIVGTDIRNVIITPDTSSQSEDVFLLNDSCTISNITIKNHYYDSINNTGYAFRFAPNAVMSERSPYIQNITVITQETSEGAGDAGRGAWIDGSEIHAASPNATMLFHSCTFISPGADVINMTNGVRVEWLNSFTYYANRGLYAFSGVSGRTSEDGSTVIYGAELRSIGSANVYGTYGAVADGADTLMYLIQHNFGYIGAGNKSDNNEADVIQANEVVELNSGQIHFVSTDQQGNFRVGDNFFVDLSTGNTSINIDTGTIESLSGLIINSPGGTTVIAGSEITTGNLLLDGNTISTATEDLDINSATNIININDNTSVSGNLDIRDNFSFGGTLNIAGDQPGRTTANDKLTFNVDFEQDFKPHVTLTHSLGEAVRPWVEANLDRAEIDDVTIDENYITSNASNATLDLFANGTGRIYVPSNNVQIDNNLTVDGVTTIQGSSLVGTVNYVGDKTQIGDYTLTNLNVNGNIDVSSQAQFEEILFDGNVIQTTTSNADLELRANGTGRILIPTENVQVNNNLSADNIFNNNNVNVTLQTEFGSADVSDVDIVGNYISTNNNNLNLELLANGTGRIYIPSNDFEIDNDFTVNGETILQDDVTTYEYGPELVVNGTFDSNLTGWAQAGGGSATATGGNLRINATGAARNVSQEIIVVPGKTYDFEAQFRSVSNGNPFYLRIFESGVGTLFEWNETSGLVPDQELTFSFVPAGTAIDIIFRAVDTVVEWDNVSMFEDIGLVTTFTPVQVTVNGDITHTGNKTQTGNMSVTGDTDVDGNITISSQFAKSNILFNGNILRNTGEGLRIAADPYNSLSLPQIVNAIVGGATAEDYVDQSVKNLINFLIDNDYVDVNRSGSLTTSDYLQYLQYVANGTTGDIQYDQFLSNVINEMIALEYATPGYFSSEVFDGDYFRSDFIFSANGAGNVVFPTNDVVIENNIFAASISSEKDFNLNVANNVILTTTTTTVDDNFIETIISNANLELRAPLNRAILVPTENVTFENNLTVDGNTDIDDLVVQGNISQTGNRTQVGNLVLTGVLNVTSLNAQNNLQFDEILFDKNSITTTSSNADLDLRANGTGIIDIPLHNVKINNNLSLGTLNSADININSSIAFEEFNLSSNIQLFDNVITTTESNSNLELRTIDNSSIRLKDLFFNDNDISTLTEDIDITANNNVIINSDSAILLPKGTTAQRQKIDNSIRFNTEDSLFEGFKNNRTITFNGVYSDNRRTSLVAHPTNDTLNFTVQSVGVSSVDANGLTIHSLDVDDILIQTNIIRTNVSNSDLELKTNGTGKLVLDDITLLSDTFENTSGTALTINHTLYGKAKFNSHSVSIPSGTNAEQPASPEVGTTRWNTDEEVLEVWDGSTFITAAGTSATISQAEMDDLILEYTLIFG
jgi:hypothetical protein